VQPHVVNYDEVAHIRPLQTRTGGPTRREVPFVEYEGGELALFLEDGQAYVYWRGEHPPSWLEVSALVLAKEEEARALLS
jgi:hypothetical protein